MWYLHSSMVRLESILTVLGCQVSKYLHSSMVRLESYNTLKTFVILTVIYIPVWLD